MIVSIPQGVIEALRGAHRITVLTGAGISAESGIPTFRDALTGLWARYEASELATPEAFKQNPELVTRWYDWRRGLCAAAKPNPGHLALATLQRMVEEQGRRFTLITQNVDRLHQAAGSREVIELHGSIWVWRCISCREEKEERGGPFPEYPPKCRCGGIRRPGVVWFGESLPREALSLAEQAAADCDLFLAIGTSGQVYPAAALPLTAIRNGALVVEINAESTPLSGKAHHALHSAAGVVLPELVRLAFGVMNND